jgi:hypothetical protein
VVLGPVNHPDGGQDLPVRLGLCKVFSQGQEGGDMVIGKVEPAVAGSPKRRIISELLI